MGMDYSRVKDWIIREDSFDADHLGKCEAIMSLGNGYMGLRSATEERYLGETRDMLVNGTFNKFDENEVTELPNAEHRTIMLARYFSGKRWEDIARQMHYSTRRIFGLHAEALQELERLLAKEEGEYAEKA